MVMHIITACVVLHNLLHQKLGRGHFQPENIGLNLEGVWQGNHLPYWGENVTAAGKAQQSVFANYLRTKGAVPGQLDSILNVCTKNKIKSQWTISVFFIFFEIYCMFHVLFYMYLYTIVKNVQFIHIFWCQCIF